MLGRLRRRGTPPPPAGPALAPDALDLTRYPGVEPLLDRGDVAGATALIAGGDPSLTQDVVARIDLQLRNEAFRRASLRPEPAVEWPPRTDLSLGGSGALPEVAPAQLDRDVLVAGVRHHGALIVRGFLPQQACTTLCSMIDGSMAAFEEDRDRIDPQWNVPLRDVQGQVLGDPLFRMLNHDAAGLAVADAPAAAAFVLQQFRELGLPELVGSYLGERPAVSLEKWTMRRVPVDTGSSWHQDGAFLGTDTRTLNMWIALSDCGERASGLDVVAHRFDHIVTTGTPGAYFDWDVSPTIVDQERGDDPIVSPVFKAGDAVFFDQFLLHKTGTGDDLTEERYALETWFFTPTSFPGKYAGLLV